MGSQVTKRNILIVTCEPLPLPDAPATGGGLRAHNLGEALRSQGHSVVYSMPRACLDHSSSVPEQWRKQAHSVTDIKELVRDIDPDVVLFANWALAGESPTLDCPVVLDLNGSLILENYYRGNALIRDDACKKLVAMTKIDMCITGSVRQKMYFMAWALMAGMEPDSLMMEVIPFSLPDDLPDPSKPREPLLMMAGYDWPWLDGGHVVETVSNTLEHLKSGRLDVYTSTPRYRDVMPGEDSSDNRTGHLHDISLPRVSVKAPVVYEELTKKLNEGLAAVDVWSSSPERELAYPARTLVYMWAGLPVIIGSNSALAERVSSYEAGWIVDPAKSTELADLLRKIIGDPAVAARRGKNAQRLIRDHFLRSRTISPLVRFCEELPTRVRKGRILPLVEKAHDLERELADLGTARDRLERRLSETLEEMRHHRETYERRLAEMRSEHDLFSNVHRRPRGFAILKSSTLLRRSLRRSCCGFPVLVYLLALAGIGERLHRLWMRTKRR